MTAHTRILDKEKLRKVHALMVGGKTPAERLSAQMKSNPELPDREIARRAGVSPQTVNNWRKRNGA